MDLRENFSFKRCAKRDALSFIGWHHAGANAELWGKRKEHEVRELHCVCGNRVVADDDEQLVQQVLTHAHEVHPEMDLTEEQARQMVAAQASDTEDPSY